MMNNKILVIAGDAAVFEGNPSMPRAADGGKMYRVCPEVAFEFDTCPRNCGFVEQGLNGGRHYERLLEIYLSVM